MGLFGNVRKLKEEAEKAAARARLAEAIEKDKKRRFYEEQRERFQRGKNKLR